MPDNVKHKKPMDIIIEIENARMRAGYKKKDLCDLAGINPEMYSYLMACGRDNKELPELCLAKVREALRKLEKKHA